MNRTSISQVFLHAELMQFFPRLTCKVTCYCRQKCMQLAVKNTRLAGKIAAKRWHKYSRWQAKMHANCKQNTRNRKKNTRNRRQNYLQLQTIIIAIAVKLYWILLVKLFLTCQIYYMPSRVLRVRGNRRLCR